MPESQYSPTARGAGAWNQTAPPHKKGVSYIFMTPEKVPICPRSHFARNGGLIITARSSASLTSWAGPVKRCGIDDTRVLHIDHIQGDGRVDRAKYRKGSHEHAIKALVAGNLHDRFQLLCANCHLIKTREAGEFNQGRRRYQPT